MHETKYGGMGAIILLSGMGVDMSIDILGDDVVVYEVGGSGRDVVGRLC